MSRLFWDVANSACSFHSPSNAQSTHSIRHSSRSIDYVDFIRIDAILSNYSSQNCNEIYIVEKAFCQKLKGSL
jgi:hypothetical protein